MSVLEFTTNPFRGVIIDNTALPDDTEVFRSHLRESLDAWKAEGYRVAWLEAHLARAALIPVAVDAGFTFHHSGGGYVMMTCRMEKGAFVPEYASHYIGAGGVVINERRELLVVHEAGRRPPGKRSYKLPGGALLAGEDLEEGVVREVLEETGVATRFEAVVCLRNLHDYRYGKSDIYFVCRLSPLTHEITMQADEIEDCLWMPLDEYMSADNVSDFNKVIVRAALETPGLVRTRVDGYRNRRLETYIAGWDGVVVEGP
jgi:8-oxo-dGTP pyrophosphatase MutT (NUDIX family)